MPRRRPPIDLLEAFYYIMLHQGIEAAAEFMPDDIRLSRSRLSEKLNLLEKEYLGPLIKRRPFGALANGAATFELIRPTFQNLDRWVDEDNETAAPTFRVGTPSLILHNHFAPLMAQIKAAFGEVTFNSVSGDEDILQDLLNRGAIDLMIAPNAAAPKDGERFVLGSGRLALLVRKSSCVTHPAKWHFQMGPKEHVACPHEQTTVGRHFRDYLRAQKINPPFSIRPGTTADVVSLVSSQGGIGVVIDYPGVQVPKDMRLVGLPDTSPVEIAAAWRLPATRLLTIVLDAVKRRAATVWSPRAGGEAPRSKRQAPENFQGPRIK